VASSQACKIKGLATTESLRKKTAITGGSSAPPKISTICFFHGSAWSVFLSNFSVDLFSGSIHRKKLYPKKITLCGDWFLDTNKILLIN